MHQTGTPQQALDQQPNHLNKIDHTPSMSVHLKAPIINDNTQ